MIPHEESHVDTHHLGQRVLIYDSLDSTNARAIQMADDPANHGVVILAEEQTAGRGQQGRSWQAPAGRAVLMSVLLFPPPPLRRPALLTAWAAVAVCETIRQATGLQAKIKWPNDVLLRGRKVCGILIESRVQLPSPLRGGEVSGLDLSPQPPSLRGKGELNVDWAVVAGIGLNVNQTAEDFAKAGLPQAGSLALLAGKTLDCMMLARLLVEKLDEEYDRLIQGDTSTLEACWKWHMGLLGKQVALECSEGIHWGRLRELTLDELELEMAAGEIRRFLPETVRHIRPA
jgi:BirA family transcriptional regulator, biotin operon repressor / biotin---[acetyl-CoA-carboxylase] ligase